MNRCANLSLYRIALGQTKQEELLEYLIRENKEVELKDLFINYGKVLFGKEMEDEIRRHQKLLFARIEEKKEEKFE